MVSRPRLVISHADAARLEEIWKNHSTSILGMLRTFCSSPEDAQDALQELFLRIGKNPAVVESAKSQRAFLIVAARRIAIDIARKRSSEQARLESPESVEALHPAQESKKNDPELEAAISAVVQKLPPEQRAVFIAKIIQGKTLAVIAAEQNITLNTAASRLRYSLDKIRNQLRPHYEAMKNQTNSLSDSPERLIKPLEPKRVPSVFPGLDGVAAMAPDDSDNLCIFLPPEDEGSFVPFEDGEQPTDSTDDAVIAEEEITEEPILVVCEPFIDLPAEEEEPIDLSEQPVDEILTEIFEGETPIDPGSEDLVGEDGSLFSCWNYLSAFDGELQVIDDSSGDSGDESGTDDWSDWDLGEYYNDLLKEYDAFLAENPDWITENSGGDMHAQVITPSQHTGLELSDPGAAQAFDIWFYNNYIAPYENEAPVDEGSLNLAGQPHDYGTLLTTDQPDRTGIPEAWIRGGSVQLSGGGEIVYQSGIVTFDQGSTPFMLGSQNNVANGGEGTLHANGLSLEKSYDQDLGASKISANNQTFGPGNYQFTTEEVVSDQENDASTEASSGQAPTEVAKEQSVSKEIPPSNFSSVVPIVSGSEETIDSFSNDRPMFTENTKFSFAAADLPTLVETKTASAPEESHMMDDIAFTDDDSFVPAPTAETNTVAPESNAPAKTDVAAAVGGAFTVGTATQAAPTRGASVKKVMPA